MKIVKILTIVTFVIAMGFSCNKGIDPITEVAPKQDAADPTLSIKYPIDGKIVRSDQEVATVVFKVEAVDDVELKSVVLFYDDAELVTFNSFKDYRRAMIEYPFTNLTDGNHTLKAVSNRP